MEKEYVVSVVSSVMDLMRLPISCARSMVMSNMSCHVPAVSTANGQSTGQFGILVNLVLCCLYGCCTWLGIIIIIIIIVVVVVVVVEV